ncbi:MAG: hypothetical protein A3F18_06645 [Legionellales bacterium RIFCSPHIGHO2_12_FULL_37_14]|nr:MAG: hypothetical protein A3F18_06645 [Legionellales bacterium RIFCSPHIGHO2_12_FULL_37_14]
MRPFQQREAYMPNFRQLTAADQLQIRQLELSNTQGLIDEFHNSNLANLRAVPLLLNPKKYRAKSTPNFRLYSVKQLTSLANENFLLEDPEVLFPEYKIRYVVNMDGILLLARSGEINEQMIAHYQMISPNDYTEAASLAAGYIIFTKNNILGNFEISGIDLDAKGYRFPLAAICHPLNILAHSSARALMKPSINVGQRCASSSQDDNAALRINLADFMQNFAMHVVIQPNYIDSIINNHQELYRSSLVSRTLFQAQDTDSDSDSYNLEVYEENRP